MSQEIYRKMYAVLCGAVSDAIDVLQNPHNGLCARCLLEKALLQAEELYLSSDEEERVEVL